MPAKKYRIKLDATERIELEKIRDKGTHSSLRYKRAVILLLSDESEQGSHKPDSEICEVIGVSMRTVERLRKRCHEVGALASLKSKPHPPRPDLLKVTGELEAQITQIACSEAPDGRSFWTTQLIADEVVALGLIDSLSAKSVERLLKKSELAPWKNEYWCIPKKDNAAFVAKMEDVLEVYHRAPNAEIPLVCLDEFSKQLLADVTAPLAPRLGDIEKVDYEYERRGSSTAYMMALPHLGTRSIFMSENGTQNGIDFAHAIEHLATKVLPDSKKIVLVMDNHTTHSEASLYRAFAPEKARELCERLEIHYTPKHGSWLNMAEIEIGKVVNYGLKKRVSSREEMRTSLEAYQQRENQKPKIINWQFTNEKARIKLKSLYPSI